VPTSDQRNRLSAETSPYLLQHAHNPVDWYPWCEEALERARAEDRPILLSIGYSACHWCHVMAHESFENEDVARVMNELFVCIKVDREERPDLDKIYQLAHQMLAQRPGGWPLNMFLMPGDHTPFFGGTYFPREPRYGMPGFVDVLQRVAAFHREHREELQQQNASMREAFARMEARHAAAARQIDDSVLAAAQRQLESQFDARHGGFGGAPKFPHPTNLERCLRWWAAAAGGGRADANALSMARVTLHAMASGGIYDQVGGGFCRYSVDAEWMIPHFEKMLYDNGPLQAVYTDAFLATGEAEFARIAAGIGEWVMREMQAPEGGYFSTLDADSEGEEGKYYVWTAEEIRAALDDEQWQVVLRRYGLDGSPNFEGRWHLHARLPLDRVAHEVGITPERARGLLDAAHAALFTQRERRVRPGRDEKILTSWNGLMIKGMARAGRVLERPDFVDSATLAMDAIRGGLWRDGRLLATARDGRAHLNAYLDDYAFVADAALELLQARWRPADLDFACALADVLLDHFEDRAQGGFYFTSDDHETLLHRHKPLADESTPSGNAVAVQMLLRLGHLLGEQRYLEAAERALRAAFPSVLQNPSAHGALLNAIEDYLDPAQIVVLRGEPSALQDWLARCRARYAPRRLAVAVPADAQGLRGGLSERAPRGLAVAYVCSGFQCGAPVTTLADLHRALADAEAPPPGPEG
jgi:hypothetical protein